MWWLTNFFNNKLSDDKILWQNNLVMKTFCDELNASMTKLKTQIVIKFVLWQNLKNQITNNK